MCMEKTGSAEVVTPRCSGNCAGPGQPKAPVTELQEQFQKCHGGHEGSADTSEASVKK